MKQTYSLKEAALPQATEQEVRVQLDNERMERAAGNNATADAIRGRINALTAPYNVQVLGSTGI